MTENQCPSFSFSQVSVYPIFEADSKHKLLFFDMFSCRQFWEGNFDGQYLLTLNFSWDKIWHGTSVQNRELVGQILDPIQVFGSVFKASQRISWSKIDSLKKDVKWASSLISMVEFVLNQY